MLRQGFNDLGYVEGRNIILENRFPAEIPERFISLAAELAALNVDVLVAAIRLDDFGCAACNVNDPIAFVYVADPAGSKLVTGLARPGENLRGWSNFAADLTAEWVEFLKALGPGASRPAILADPKDEVSVRRYIEESQAAATGERRRWNKYASSTLTRRVPQGRLGVCLFTGLHCARELRPRYFPHFAFEQI